MTFPEIGKAVGELVQRKQTAYGDSFGKSGEVLRILYPEGIPASKLQDAGTVMRVIDKLFRIATDRDAFGEDPWQDVMGYAMLAHERRLRSKPLSENYYHPADPNYGSTWGKP